MNQQDIIKKIYARRWDNRVQRPGFLQSKLIVTEAINQKIQLTKKISVHDANNIWIKTSALYDQDFYDNLLNKIFPAAFKEDKRWPLIIFDALDKATEEARELIKAMNERNWSSATTKDKIVCSQKYVQIQYDIQKYYTIAVPLTNYCESVLRNSKEDLLSFAVQYKPLDIDLMNNSLLRIKKQATTSNRKTLMKKHLQQFGWIKSNYNIIGVYTGAEVLREINSHIPVFKVITPPNSPLAHITTGLQVGIYLRNRMKELSQQIWFAYERLALSIAHDLSLSREDFLQLSSQEVISSLQKKHLVIRRKEIQNRHAGFVAGTIDGESFILVGKIVDKLFSHFNKSNIDITELRGVGACKGLVSGTVKVINDVSEINKLNSGDILVTSMTTPDFIVAMKKAGAIITDEGGLSCHAAIVSRELNIPCVIGTKIATKFLHDRDRVEVNADQGIIRKLT